jgi:hypothetical protein
MVSRIMQGWRSAAVVSRGLLIRGPWALCVGAQFLAWGLSARICEGAPVNPSGPSKVRYATEFAGTDIGAQVNAAFADCANACEVSIPAGTYNAWTTQIKMTAPTQSLVGAGSALTVLNYTGTGVGILWQMSPFSVAQAGKINGITIFGTASGVAGVESGSVIGGSFDDLVIDGFTGNGGSCLWLNNVAGGWMERSVMTRVQMGAFKGCTKGLRLTVNGGTISFGYNRWTDIKLNANAGQIGISSEGALYLYHSQLSVTCNSSTTTSTCISLTGNSNWNSNVYDIVGENPQRGKGISVAAGSLFKGHGVIDLSGMTLTNGNGGTYGGSFRVLPSSPAVTEDGGTVSSFLGSGVAAQAYPSVTNGMDSPEGFGVWSGANIASPYALMYNYGGNAFVVGTVNYNQPISSMAPVARIDTHGNVHVGGAVYANGSDYAESVQVNGSTDQYEPGDVLAIDRGDRGHFQKAAEPYTTRVAGVYSTKPGVLGSQHGLGTAEFQSEIPLAMTGIVPCKVTTENGAIHRGDLLVSSSRAGYAMRGTDRIRMTGAVIGKALESLQTGDGTISILVTLQ